MAWVYLTVAVLLEIVWASAMKHSEGFTELWPTIISLVGMVASMVLLSISMKTLPLGTAYSVWTGIGAAGAFIFGIVILGEQASTGDPRNPPPSSGREPTSQVLGESAFLVGGALPANTMSRMEARGPAGTQPCYSSRPRSAQSDGGPQQIVDPRPRPGNRRHCPALPRRGRPRRRG